MIAGDRLEYNQEIHDAATDWHVLMMSGLASAEEKVAFQAWLSSDPRHGDAYDQAVTLWAALGQLEPAQIKPSLLQDKPNWYANFVAQLIDVISTAKPRFVHITTSLVIVLCVLVAFVPWWNTSDDIVQAPVTSVYKTDVASSETFTLKDGSIIVLGAASEVETVISAVERRVTLVKGAVLFDVSSDPGRPFFVDANEFKVRVTGTIFDLRNNGGVVRLSVAEGSVDVSYPFMIDSKPSSMIARRNVKIGEQVAARPETGLSAISGFRQTDFAAWREDRLKYKGATLAELIADANRYSERPIVIADSLKSAVLEPVTVAFNGREIERMIHTLPGFFDVAVRDDGVGPIVISAR